MRTCPPFNLRWHHAIDAGAFLRVGMTAPTLETVQAYYDERVEGKLRDFTEANPRIEAAIQLVAEWAPPEPSRILEIGCGIGATCWRMARAWPQAEVVGADVSPLSIEVAKTCFQLPNLSYREGLVQEGTLSGKFDLVLLMDTYEHIAVNDRPALHAVIKALLSEESRLFVTVPTPAILNHARETRAFELQPVDENVTLSDIIVFARETSTQLLYYREVGVWRYGDYAHAVLGRYQALANVKIREHDPLPIRAIKRRAKRLLRRDHTWPTGRRDYLGWDVLGRVPRHPDDRFGVSISMRKRLASSWLRRHTSERES